MWIIQGLKFKFIQKSNWANTTVWFFGFLFVVVFFLHLGFHMLIFCFVTFLNIYDIIMANFFNQMRILIMLKPTYS